MEMQNKAKELESQHYHRIYDPEIVSILLTVVSTLGSIAAVIDVGMNIAQKCDDKKQNECKKRQNSVTQKRSILRDIRRANIELRRSITSIEYYIDLLQEMYNDSIMPNYREEEMRFGNGFMKLTRSELNIFYRLHIDIHSEAINISTNLHSLEESLYDSMYQSILPDGTSNQARKMVLRESNNIDHLLSLYGKYDIFSFISATERCCKNLYRSLDRLEEIIEHYL